MVSDWWALWLLGLYLGITLIAPRILARPTLVWKHPRTVVFWWIACLLISLLALTLGLGILIARAVSHHVTQIHDHEWLWPLIDSILGWVAIGVIGIIAFRLGVAGAELRAENLSRNEQLSRLATTASIQNVHGHNVLVVDSPLKLVGVITHVKKILVTSALLKTLSPAQLSAAIAHEQAHLDGHHAALLTLGELAERSAAGFSASRRMAQALRITTELIADDAAARRFDPATVADALELSYADNPLVAERVLRLRAWS